MACWALWQRMPPRYQLTTKEIGEEELEITSAPQSPRTTGTARSTVAQSRPVTSTRRVRPSSARAESARSEYGQPTMFFHVTSPRDVVADTSSSPRPAFPVRRSPFLDTFKQQQRINSARQTFQDPSTTTPRSYTPNMRARTASSNSSMQFPVTHLASHDDIRCQKHTAPFIRKQGKQQADIKTSDIALSPRPQHPKSAGYKAQPQNKLFVNTIVPFEPTSKPFVKNHLYPDASSRRHVMHGLKNATMIIDNNRVAVIKNNRASCSDVDDSTSYIAHLRKLYLQEPRDLAKINKPIEKDLSKSKLIRERLEYDKRTDHILKYYGRESEDLRSPRSPVRGRSHLHRRASAEIPATARASTGRERRPTSSSYRSPNRSRPQSARLSTSPLRTAQNPNEPQNCSKKRDALADWNVFLNINSQSTLHERNQFYLQTPRSPHTSKTPGDCECHLCRLELKMSIPNDKEGLAQCEHHNQPITEAVTKLDDKTKQTTENEKTSCLDQQQIDQSNTTQGPTVNQKIDRGTQVFIIDFSKDKQQNKACEIVHNGSPDDIIHSKTEIGNQIHKLSSPLVIPSEVMNNSQEEEPLVDTTKQPGPCEILNQFAVSENDHNIGNTKDIKVQFPASVSTIKDAANKEHVVDYDDGAEFNQSSTNGAYIMANIITNDIVDGACDDVHAQIDTNIVADITLDDQSFEISATQ